MLKPISTLFLLLCFAAAMPGQGFEQHRGQGYAFFAPGKVESTAVLHFGAGGERFIYRGLAAGGDIGYLFPAESFRYGVGLLSVNGSYHLNRNSHWIVSPFITSGYSMAFRGAPANMVNVGGGLNYWIGERTGLRVEFRDHIQPGYRATHLLEFRLGLAFR